MNRFKLFIGFSAIISLFMCTLTSSKYFLYSSDIISYDTKSLLLDKILINAFHFKNISALNVILMLMFLLNFASLILYFIKFNTKGEIKKYFSFWSTLLLILGLSLFLIYVFSTIKYYDLQPDYEYFYLKYRILRWLPRILIFTVPTIYLIFVQIYLVKKSKCRNFTCRFIILSIYASSLIFLTLITFFQFSIFFDFFIGHYKLKTCAVIRGDQIFGETYANINYYLYYVLFLTLLSGLLMIFSKNKSKKQALKA